MKDLFKIAWRNLNRNKVRTVIAILAITTVVAIVVFSRGLILGFSDNTYDLYIDNNLGHARIIQSEYRNREALLSLDYGIDGFQGAGLENMLLEIKELEETEYIVPRLKFGALYGGQANEMVRMAGFGIDPVAEKRHGLLLEEINRGRMPEEGNEILVGVGLLDKLKADIGDQVTFMFTNYYQSLQGRTFTIVGVRESGFSEFDDNFFYLPLTTVQSMLGMEDQATEIMVFSTSRDRAEELEESLAILFQERDGTDNYSALAWQRTDPILELFLEMESIFDFIYIAIILMGTIAVISTLKMIIRERITEIGMMSALGLKPRDILKIFTVEGALMGIIGSAFGVLSGGLINLYLSRAGLHVQAYADTISGMDVLVEPAFYPVFNLENLLVSFILGATVVTITCLWPARSAARLDPVTALHHDS